MKELLVVLSISVVLLYIIASCVYHAGINGESKISFHTFLTLYKSAPEKWSPHWEYGYLFYETGTCSREFVYMKTYLDRILFYIWGWRRKWKEEKLEETENTLKLIEHWQYFYIFNKRLYVMRQEI